MTNDDIGGGFVGRRRSQNIQIGAADTAGFDLDQLSAQRTLDSSVQQYNRVACARAGAFDKRVPNPATRHSLP